MRDQLAHRGPDSQGFFLSADVTVGLGFRRLKIIDLSADANQPLPNEDGSVQLLFNGEIYNFKDLRDRLIATGHRFRSRSDAEVVVHLYEDAGERFVDQLDGMFAIALWDGRRRRLVLARDRAGKKPLFVYRDARRLLFDTRGHDARRADPRGPRGSDPVLSGLWVRAGARHDLSPRVADRARHGDDNRSGRNGEV